MKEDTVYTYSHDNFRIVCLDLAARQNQSGVELGAVGSLVYSHLLFLSFGKTRHWFIAKREDISSMLHVELKDVDKAVKWLEKMKYIQKQRGNASTNFSNEFMINPQKSHLPSKQCISKVTRKNQLAEQTDTLAEQTDTLAEQTDTLAEQTDTLAEQTDNKAKGLIKQSNKILKLNNNTIASCLAVNHVEFLEGERKTNNTSFVHKKDASEEALVHKKDASEEALVHKKNGVAAEATFIRFVEDYFIKKSSYPMRVPVNRVWKAQKELVKLHPEYTAEDWEKVIISIRRHLPLYIESTKGLEKKFILALDSYLTAEKWRELEPVNSLKKPFEEMSDEELLGIAKI